MAAVSSPPLTASPPPVTRRTVPFIVGALTLAAGQGAAQATMDGLLSNAVGDDEQGWVAGAAQSLNAAVGTVAPLMAGLLYAHVAHAAPYVLGAVLMAAAAVVIARARFTSPSLRVKTPDAAEPAPIGR